MTITIDLPPMPAAKAGPGIDRELAPFIARAAHVAVDDILARIREKWEGRAGFKKKNAELLSDLRGLAAQNAELALEFIEKHKKKK